jgi:hypothetical protein
MGALQVRPSHLAIARIAWDDLQPLAEGSMGTGTYRIPGREASACARRQGRACEGLQVRQDGGPDQRRFDLGHSLDRQEP